MTWLFQHPASRGMIGWATVVTHVAACVGLLLISPGTETNPDWGERLQFVSEHRLLWNGVWVVWMLTSASLLTFCLAWMAAMNLATPHARLASIACGIVGVGVLLDFAGETTLIVAGATTNSDVASFARLVRTYQILSPAIANGLYCVGGFILSVVAWQSGWLRGLPGVLGFAVWGVGGALTVATLVDHRQAMIATGGAVMMLFIVFAADVSWRMYHHHVALGS